MSHGGELDGFPHRRQSALSGEWVLVSPHRTERPWLGQSEPAAVEAQPAHDPQCYLCPGNRRASGRMNPTYERTFVFDNDFSALLGDAPDRTPADDDLFVAEGVRGACRVLCYSPRHDLTLADLEASEIAAVVDAWAAETAALGDRFAWVQVFENKGALMGCSNLHPHGQVWASSRLPNEAVKEDSRQRAYLDAHGGSLLVDYASREIERGERLVRMNADWAAVVPYWAVWPFETLIVARRPVARLPSLRPAERSSLSDLLHDLLSGYDRLFGVPCPYSMGWHGAPFVPGAEGHWQLHAHLFPPLLRSATVRKHMVGYEMLAEPQRDLTPELAANRLRLAVGS
jgi:UDPglucose--hexose-1-phosphate uridylyltransferase